MLAESESATKKRGMLRMRKLCHHLLLCVPIEPRLGVEWEIIRLIWKHCFVASAGRISLISAGWCKPAVKIEIKITCCYPSDILLLNILCRSLLIYLLYLCDVCFNLDNVHALSFCTLCTSYCDQNHSFAKFAIKPSNFNT